MLKEHGFGQFTTRTAWRHDHDRIDVINFQSFNSYQASVIGCTTYSFALNLGCYLLYIPGQHGPSVIKEGNGLLLPKESLCHMRGRLRPQKRQKLLQRFLPQRAPDDIWAIHAGGKNLESSMAEADARLGSQGLAWFRQFDEPCEVLRILTSEAERMGELWGFGNNPSPNRSYCTGYAALKTGQFGLAAQQLKAAVDSGCYGAVHGQLLTDIQRAANPSFKRTPISSNV